MYRRPPPLRKKSGERFLFDGRGRLYTGYFSYSFGIETINTFIRSRSSFENHTRYQTKIKRLKQSPRRGRARSPHFLKKKKEKKKKEKKYKFSNKRNLIFDRIRIFDWQASPKHPNYFDWSVSILYHMVILKTTIFTLTQGHPATISISKA